MPLLTICGIPSSGKTIRANQIKEYFEKRIKETSPKPISQVVLINEEHLLIPKIEYSDVGSEKKIRGNLISAVERYLNKDTLVILDSLNYIKGFRYQLYCVARAIGTPHCVVHCNSPIDKAREWNKQRENGYEPNTFEEPDKRNRWDSPLFTVLFDDETLPTDELWSALILKRPPPPNLSTVSKPVSETNYLYELDKTTQDILNSVLDSQKTYGNGFICTVPKASQKVHLPPRSVSLVEIRRLRRQFIGLNKMHTLLDMDRVADMFVDYLNTNFQE